MAVPVIESKSTATRTSNGLNINLTAPSGINDGDLLLIVLGIDGNPIIFTPPTGFIDITPLNGDKGPSDRITLFAAFKIASGESGDYNTTWISNQQGTGHMYRISGAGISSPIQSDGSVNSGSTGDSTALGFTTDTPDTLALALHAIDRDRITDGQSDGGTGWTTEDIIESGGANGAACGVSRKNITTAGSTLDSTQALSNNDEFVTRQIGIREVSTELRTHTTNSFLTSITKEIEHTTDSLLTHERQITINGNQNFLTGNRALVSNGSDLYYFGGDDTVGETALRCFKSTDTGKTWAEQDRANALTGANIGAVSAAIDSAGIVYTVIQQFSVGPLETREKRFNTNTDLWVAGTVIINSDTTTITASQISTAIIIDQNDDPHCVFLESNTFRELQYSNKIGGTWKTPVVVESTGDHQLLDMCFDDRGFPIIISSNTTATQFEAEFGDALDAASFTQFIVSTNSTGTVRGIAKDEDGDIIVAWREAVNQVQTRRHNAGDAIGTWQTAKNVDGTTNNLQGGSLSAKGKSFYFLTQFLVTDVVRLYREINDGGWALQERDNSLREFDKGVITNANISRWAEFNEPWGEQLDVSYYVTTTDFAWHGFYSANNKTHTTDSLLAVSGATVVTVDHDTDSLLEKHIELTHTTDSSLLKHQTVTHTTDSLLLKIQTVVHTTDSLLKKFGILVTHNTDSLLKKLGILITHNTDSLLLKIQTITHTTDSFLRKTIEITHTTDSLLKKTQTVIHTTDSLLKKLGILITHTTDSTLVKKLIIVHTTDSLLQKIQTLTHTTDSVLKKLGILVTHTTDSLLKKIQTLTHTTDSLLRKIQTLTHTTDSLLKKTQTITHTTDSFLKKAVGHSTDSFLKRAIAHSTDALLLKIQTLTHTTDSLLKFRVIVTHTTDSVLKKFGIIVTHNTDSLLKKIQTVTHTTDSLLKKFGILVTHTTDSLLLKIQTVTHTTDSLLKKLGQTVDHNTDSLLQQVDNLLTHTTDALLVKIITLTHTTDSLLKKLGILVTHNTDSLLKAIGLLVTHTTDSLLLKIQTLTHTTDSLLKKLDQTEDHTTDSLLVSGAAIEITHTTDSFLSASKTLTHTTDSLLKAIGLTLTHTTDSLLLKIQTLTHTTDSLLRIADVTHTTNALLKTPFVIVSSIQFEIPELLPPLLSHTTDSKLVGAALITHSTDALLVVNRTSVIHTTNSLLASKFITVSSIQFEIPGLQPAVKIHTTDSLLRTGRLVSHLTESFLVDAGILLIRYLVKYKQ